MKLNPMSNGSIPFLLTLSLMILAEPIQAQPNAHYNVLFIVIDDMNDRIGLLGSPEVVSPNLKRLAAHGMVFKDAYCQYALCNPSRTSFLSGWRPDKTKIFTNHVRPRSVMGPDVKFLPEYFKYYGYHIERYGKIMHNLYENDIAWDYAEPSESSNELQEGDSKGNCTGKYGVTAGPDWWINDKTDDQINARVSRLVARMKQDVGQPFFYALGLLVHHPFTPSLKYWNKNGDPSVQELLPVDSSGAISNLKGNGSQPIVIPATPAGDRSDVACIAFTGQEVVTGLNLKRVIHAYDGEVAQMDEELGVVLDEMDRQNLWKNTVVVFLSDHGQHLGEHAGLWGKETLFEESLHVPLIVCAPGMVAGECTRLVELVDLYPTLAELCGLPSPAAMQGQNFAPLLANPGLPWKNAVFSQVKRGSVMGKSVRTKQYRYNSWGVTGEELYNHNADPHEYNNLATDPNYTSMLKEMRKILADGWTKSARQSASVENVSIGKSPPLFVYPIPSNGSLTVTYNCINAGKLLFKVFDNVGKMVFSTTNLAIKGINFYHPNFSNLANGIYYLELDNSSEQKRLKFIIQK